MSYRTERIVRSVDLGAEVSRGHSRPGNEPARRGGEAGGLTLDEGPNGPREGLNGEANRTHDS